MMLNVQFKTVFVLLWCNLEHIDGAFYEINRELRYLDTSSKFTDRSAIGCCLLCDNIQNCRVANYDKTNRSCEIGARPSIKDVHLSSATGWDMLTLAVTCAPGWTKHKTSCYKLLTNLQTWDGAQEECGLLHDGGHLADIHSEAINDLLKGLYDQLPLTYKYIWVGGYRTPEGIFKWRDQSRVSDSFQNWRANQPDFYLENEYCMHVDARRNFVWNDGICEDEALPFCEY